MLFADDDSPLIIVFDMPSDHVDIDVKPAFIGDITGSIGNVIPLKLLLNVILVAPDNGGIPRAAHTAAVVGPSSVFAVPGTLRRY